MLTLNYFVKELLTMAGLIPLNRRNNGLARPGMSTGFDDFYNMLDDFFSDGLLSNRSLLRDTFKLDIAETDKDFSVEAELPGVRKEEIDLSVDDESLCITVTRAEESEGGRNFIHRERRVASMSRRIRLAGAKLDDIKAKLDEGVLTVTIPKFEKVETSRKIDIE